MTETLSFAGMGVGPRDARGMPAPLSPSQALAYDEAVRLLPVSDVFFVSGQPGTGKSLLLRHLHARFGGRLLTLADTLRAIDEGEPDHLEESIVQLIERGFEDHDIVFFDDFWNVTSFGSFADRVYWIYDLFRTVVRRAAERGKTFVSVVYGNARDHDRGAVGASVHLPAFDRNDRKFILEHHLGRTVPEEAIAVLDLHHSGVNGYVLEGAGRALAATHSGPVTGECLVQTFDGIVRRSNLRLGEVEDVEARGLAGVEDHMDVLERTVLMPINRPDLAKDLGLQAARGVLLYGPPGTGKTSLGRMLAHRLKGKFFLIDGTWDSGDASFSTQVSALLASAAQSSPSVVFIDDADVIFKNGEATGFSRLLLSKLDGLANQSQGQVCVVMTAMNLGDMPPALIRSGRVEVWLEMTLPSLETRAEIIETFQRTMVEAVDYDPLETAALCEGFTPADLRGLVEDAKGSLAYDRAVERESPPFSQHLALAAAEIAERKRILATL